MAFRATKAAQFFERQMTYFEHPYFRPGALRLWKDVIPHAPFYTNGLTPAIILTLLYVIYDKSVGASSQAVHHHNKWNYGMFGEVVSFPGHGVNYGFNMPGLSKVGSSERYRIGSNDPELFSPFRKEPGMTRKTFDHHNHH